MTQSLAQPDATSQTDQEPAKLSAPECPKLCWLNGIPRDHPSYPAVLVGLKRCSDGESILAFWRVLKDLLGDDLSPGYDAVNNCVMKHWGRRTRLESEFAEKVVREGIVEPGPRGENDRAIRDALIALAIRELDAGRLPIRWSEAIQILALAVREQKRLDRDHLDRRALAELTRAVGRTGTERTRQRIRDELRRRSRRQPRYAMAALHATRAWNEIPTAPAHGVEKELEETLRRQGAICRVLEQALAGECSESIQVAMRLELRRDASLGLLGPFMKASTACGV